MKTVTTSPLPRRRKWITWRDCNVERL